MNLLGYLLFSIMGVILGLLGGGGSILTVPILVYYFNVPATLATGYSLFIVGVTSLVAALRYRKKRWLDYKIAIIFSVPSAIGVLFARLMVLPALPDTMRLFTIIVSKDQLILYVFAALIMVISYFMFISKEPNSNHDGYTQFMSLYALFLIGLEGFVVGGVTGFVGAGGGFIIVPALTLLAKLPLKRAIATSLLIIGAKSMIGFGGDIVSGVAYDLPFLGGVLGVTLIGTYLGVHLNQFLSPSKLRKGFAGFVLVMGVLMMAKEAQWVG